MIRAGQLDNSLGTDLKTEALGDKEEEGDVVDFFQRRARQAAWLATALRAIEPTKSETVIILDMSRNRTIKTISGHQSGSEEKVEDVIRASKRVESELQREYEWTIFELLSLKVFLERTENRWR